MHPVPQEGAADSAELAPEVLDNLSTATAACKNAQEVRPHRGFDNRGITVRLA